jgi:acetyl esterase/lipase
MMMPRSLLCLIVVLAPQFACADDAVFQQRENVVYGETDGIGLVMDIFTPTGDKNGLGVIDVISGAWHSDRGKIRDHLRAQTFQILCRKGYTVFAIRPGSISKFSAPEMIEHLNQGIRWVKQHAEEYGIDPDRLGMMGASAGGHLASLAAVTAGNDTRVKAVAVFFPPTDFLNYGGKPVETGSSERIGQMLRRLAFPQGIDGLGPEEIVQKIEAISPARRVTKESPPFLLIHGDADPVVPLQQSEALFGALKEAGVSAELIVKKGGAHPWPTLHEEVEVLANWLDRQLKD